MTCQPEKSVLEVEKIRFNYREGKEKYTAEEWIVDKYALNKAKTKLVRGLAKWRRKTVDFVDDLCLGAAEALSATTAKAPVEEKKEEKKEVKAVVNSGPTVITPKKQVTVEPAQAAEKASEGVVKDAQVIEVPQVKKPAALVPAQKSQQQEYKTIAPRAIVSRCHPDRSRQIGYRHRPRAFQHDHDDSKLRRFFGQSQRQTSCIQHTVARPAV